MKFKILVYIIAQILRFSLSLSSFTVIPPIQKVTEQCHDCWQQYSTWYIKAYFSIFEYKQCDHSSGKGNGKYNTSFPQLDTFFLWHRFIRMWNGGDTENDGQCYRYETNAEYLSNLTAYIANAVRENLHHHDKKVCYVLCKFWNHFWITSCKNRSTHWQFFQ